MWSDIAEPHFGRNHCPTDVQRTKRKFFTFQRPHCQIYTSEIENSNYRSLAHLLYLMSLEESSWNTTKTHEMLITPQHLATKMATFLLYACAWRELNNKSRQHPCWFSKTTQPGVDMERQWKGSDYFAEKQRAFIIHFLPICNLKFAGR